MPKPAGFLPQLQSLIHFEAAARHLSFTAAAQQLGTTQSAVSQQVRAIEEHLGVVLFDRQHRGVRLTPEGTEFFETVRESLDALRMATDRARARPAPDRALTIATDFGFAKLWLLPHLHSLRRAMPGIQMNIHSSQDDLASRQEKVDVNIVFDQRPVDDDAELLFAEEVIPVCSRELLRANAVHAGEPLAGLPLLHLHQPGRTRWMNWEEWFASHGMRYDVGRSALGFNDYSLLIQAAVAGHGVALGWRPLVNDLLARKELVVAQPSCIRTSRGYFVSVPASRQHHPLARHFLTWLRREREMAAHTQPDAPQAENQAATGQAQAARRQPQILMAV